MDYVCFFLKRPAGFSLGSWQLTTPKTNHDDLSGTNTLGAEPPAGTNFTMGPLV